MTKCDFCPHSINKKGKCVCPQSFCILSQADAKEILRALAGIYDEDEEDDDDDW